MTLNGNDEHCGNRRDCDRGPDPEESRRRDVKNAGIPRSLEIALAWDCQLLISLSWF